jgi:hypothetical protein
MRTREWGLLRDKLIRWQKVHSADGRFPLSPAPDGPAGGRSSPLFAAITQQGASHLGLHLITSLCQPVKREIPFPHSRDVLPKTGVFNFQETTFTASNRETYPRFDMDRGGFSLLAMGFTGSKALRSELGVKRGQTR